MPYIVRKRNNEHCVFKKGPDGEPEGDSLGCHKTPEEAEAQIAAIWANEQKAAGGLWLTREQIAVFCPDCAQKMASKGLDRLELLAAKQMPEPLLAGLCNSIGDDPGFHGRCTDKDIPIDDKDAFCAWLHHECLGIWPGEKRRKAQDLNLEEKLSKIRMAFEPQLIGTPVSAANAWVEQVYDGFVILRVGEKYFRAAYTYAEDGSVQATLPSEWEEVVRGDWVAKAQAPYLTAADISIVTLLGKHAVKALKDWELDVLAVPYGGPRKGKDTHGEFFDEKSELDLEHYPSPPVHYYHGFDPDGKPQGIPELIGEVKSIHREKDGIWYRVLLDKASDFAKRVWQAAKNQAARASSGTVAHLRRIGKDGHIDYWPVAEISLFDVEGDRQPANAYAVALPVMKAMYAAAGLTFPDDDSTGSKARGEERAPGAPAGSTSKSIPSTEGDMTEKTVAELIADEFKKRDEAAAAKAAEEKAVQDRIDLAVKAEREKLEKKFAESNRLSGFGVPYAAKFGELSPYDNLDAADQAVLAGVLMEAQRRGISKHGISEPALKALAIKLEEDKGPVGLVGQKAMKMAGVKANELNYSTQTNYGDEWIGIAYSQAIWEAIRVGTVVAAKISSIEVPRGAESIIDPLESADPTFYKVAETTDLGASGWPVATVTSSKLGTAQKVMNLAKMGARVVWTGEMEEGSVLPFIRQLRQQLERAGAEQFEHTIIDGDTAPGATANINHIGGTPAATDLYLLYDGFRKVALVTNPANSRSAGGSLVASDFIETVKLMGTAGINALDRMKVDFLIDANVHWKALDLIEVKTKDVFTQPTIENGLLTAIFGYKVNVSAFMHYKSAARKANTAGKVDQTTPANNTTGAILAVRWDQWRLGYQRRMTIETTRIPRADATEIVALMRVGLSYRDTEAAAISYNVGV